MSKDEIIRRLIQEGHDPDRVRREVGLAEVAWKIGPDGWEVADLWFLRAHEWDDEANEWEDEAYEHG